MDAEFNTFQTEILPNALNYFPGQGRWVGDRTRNPSLIAVLTSSVDDVENAEIAGARAADAIGAVVLALRPWVSSSPTCAMDYQVEILGRSVSATSGARSTLEGLTYNNGWVGPGADAYGELARNNVAQIHAMHAASFQSRSDLAYFVSYCEYKLALVANEIANADSAIRQMSDVVAGSWRPYDWIGVCNWAADTMEPMPDRIATALTDCQSQRASTGQSLASRTEEWTQARKALRQPAAGAWDR